MKKLIFLIPLFVGACNFAPKDDPLDICIPSEWRVDGAPFLSEEESATFANIRWWENFGDFALNNLIAESLQNNKDLLIASWRVVEYEALYRFVSGNQYPQITGTGSFIRRHLSAAENPGLTKLTFNRYALNLEGFFNLDIWGRIRSQSRAALAEYLSKEDARRNTVILVTASVASSYIRLRKLDKQIEISLKTLDSRKLALELALVRFENGYTSELEVKQAASSVSEAEATINQITVDQALEENRLSFLVGRNPGPIIRGRDLSNLWTVPEVPVGIPSALLGRRPDILQAEQELIARNELIGAARAAFFPDITLTGTYGVVSLHLHDLFSNKAVAWNYGGAFLQTVFDGGRLIAQLDIAEAIKKEAFYNYEKVIQNAFKEVNDALIAHQLSLELLKIEKQRFKELYDYLTLAKLQYSNGHVDYLNVLDAERTSFDAELDVVAAESNTFLTLIDLYTALGGGWIIEDDCED